MKIAEKRKNTKVVTRKNAPLVRFSYVNVIDPTPDLSGNIKYTISLIISKDNEYDIDAIKLAINNALENDGHLFAGKDPHNIKNFKWPLKDGDLEYPDNTDYANSYYVNASTYSPPTIIDSRSNEITDKNEFYSGCYGRASINFYGFNKNANQGIACGLNNLQKLEEGVNLSGKSSAKDDFADSIEELPDFL